MAHIPLRSETPADILTGKNVPVRNHYWVLKAPMTEMLMLPKPGMMLSDLSV